MTETVMPTWIQRGAAAVALTLLATSAMAQQGGLPLALRGQLVQGGLVIGKTVSGATVTLVIDRKFWWEKARKRVRDKLPVAADGLFVFGLGREAPPTAVLKVRLPNGQVISHQLKIRQRRYRVQRIKGVARKYVTPPKRQKARIKREFLMVVEARKRFSDRRDFTRPFKWPVAGRISGVYGNQRFFNGVPRQPHFGLDLAAARGRPVRAPVPGVVILTHHLFFAGKTVMLDHGRGVTTTYIHLHKILVKPGDVVTQGQIIGQVGSTGRSTGPHLHWGMNWKQIRLDPAQMMHHTVGAVRSKRRRSRSQRSRGRMHRGRRGQ